MKKVSDKPEGHSAKRIACDSCISPDSVVHLALTFLQWQLYEARSRGEPLNSLANVIQLHRQHHAREVLLAACREAIASGTVEALVERFIYNPSQVAAEALAFASVE